MPSLDGRMQPGQLTHRKQGSDTKLVIICCVVSLGLAAFSYIGPTRKAVEAMRSGFSVVALPLRQLGAACASPFQGFGNAVANLTVSQETLSELKANNEKLAARNAELEEAEHTAQRLQALLNLQSTYNLQSTGARVIASATDSWEDTITIDKGSNAGFTIGMPVLDASGVVGQIVRCDPLSSVVRVLTDEQSSISAMTQQSRSQGQLQGSADGTLSLTMVRTDQQVSVGDTVITSGLGGVYPKGLPLGKVASVSRNKSSLYLEISVLPFASSETNEEVLVVTSLTEEQEATSEEIAEANLQDSMANNAVSVAVTPQTPLTPAEAAGEPASEGEVQSSEDGEEL